VGWKKNAEHDLVILIFASVALVGKFVDDSSLPDCSGTGQFHNQMEIVAE
jgi:hypothetical protein